jgi:inner membrane protein
MAHAAVALSLGVAFVPSSGPESPSRAALKTARLGVACAVLPDADVLGFGWGIPYGHVLGHRGFTHSIVGAGLIAWLALLVARRASLPGSGMRLWSYFALCALSHGLLDAMTTGGLGVAFFAPLENGRYFLPWRPIEVSPIDPGRFLSARGLAILANEGAWIGVPCLVFATGAWLVRRRRAAALA